MKRRVASTRFPARLARTNHPCGAAVHASPSQVSVDAAPPYCFSGVLPLMDANLDAENIEQLLEAYIAEVRLGWISGYKRLGR